MSKRYFCFFIYIFSVSFGAMLSYIFFSFLMPLPVEVYLLIPFSYLVVGFIIYLFLSFKIFDFLRVLLATLSFVIFLGAEIFIYNKIRKISIGRLDYIYTFSSGVVFFLVDFLLSTFIYDRFKKIDMVIENEAMFESRSKYIQWVNDEYGERMDRLEPGWFVRLASNLLVVFLLAAFLSVAKNNFNRAFLSIALLLFVFSSVGIYLILYQYSSVMKWRFLGFRVKKDVISNWNRLIGVFLIILFVIPLLIPWNFTVFRLNFLTDFLKSLFPVIFRVSEETARESEFSLNQGNITDNNVAETMEKIVKTARDLIILLILTYSFSVVVGLLLKLIYRNKKKIPLIARFFIFCFDSLVSLLLKIRDFMRLIFELAIDFFSKRKEKKPDEKLVRHFYTFFGEYKKLPSEKQKEIESIIKEFIRLIQVSSRFVLPYTFYFGPKEYMDKVSEKVEVAREEIDEVTNIFNESRYSLHLLSDEKKQKFRKLIDLIIEKITRMF
ncbi:MAG: hypothetical protein ACP5QT_00415 [Brevinematia bacterium]